MAYAYEQDVPIGEEVYRRIIERLGPAPLEGLLMHLVVRNGDSTLRYVDVWSTKEACDRAFEERIHPAVRAAFEELRVRPAGEPRRRELSFVHLQPVR